MSKSISAIVAIPLKDLIIDISLSGRTEKEIKDHAKLLAPVMEAFGEWDQSQPGQFFVRDGKKHLLGGFTRTHAALSLGYKIGYFVERADDKSSNRVACITGNVGKPISLFEQGRIYSQMRDGDNPETAKKGETLLAAMAIKDIAAKVGYTRQHVENCIVIFGSTPEIAELITEGKVSANIVVRSAQLVKDKRKQFAFLKAAVRQAQAEGKEVATMKHLDAVRAEFAPLKADKAGSSVASTPSGTNSAAPVTPLGNPPQSTATPPMTTNKPGGKDSAQASESSKNAEPPKTSDLPGIGSVGNSEPKKKDDPDKEAKERMDLLESIIIDWADNRKIAASDDDVTELAKRILKAGE